jgi:long-chain acyl-CoA synthetase
METVQAVVYTFGQYGAKPAVVALQKQRGREIWSFTQVSDIAQRLASGLNKAGLEAGAYAILLAPNSPELISTCVALLMAGIVAVPVDPQMADEDLRHVIADSAAHWVFTNTSLAQRLVRLSVPQTLRCVLFDASETDERHWRRYVSTRVRTLPTVRPSDTAVLFYTSGTTGRPKGVPLTHQNLVANHHTLTSLNLTREGDRALLPLPLHHVYAFTAGMLALLALGLPLVLPASLTGPEIVRALREEHVSILIAVPRFYEALAAAIETRVRQRGRLLRALYRSSLAASIMLRRRFGWRIGHALFAPVRKQFAPDLRLVTSAGAALDPRLATQLEALGWSVASGYGLTETSPLLTYNPADTKHPEAVGKPVPGVEIRVALPTSDQQYGEVLAKGPNVFSGYLHLPEKTAQAFTEDGYFRTGDVGYVDAEGYLHLMGRASEMIVLPGGENIRPEMVENVFARSDHVREVAVLEYDHRLVALLVPKLIEQPQRDTALVEHAIHQDIEQLSRTLPSHHRLSDYALTVDALPRTRLGKLRRHLLVARYQQAKRQTGLTQQTGPLPLAEMSFEDQQLLEDDMVLRTWEWLGRRFARVRLTPDSHVQLDLGIDSLAWLALTLEIRAAVGADLDEDAISRIEVVRDLLREVIAAKHESARGLAPLEALQQPEHLLSVAQQQWLQPPGLIARVASRTVTAVTSLCLWRFFALQVIGLENLPQHGPFIIAPNHVSLLDPPVVAAALPPVVLARTYWGGWTGIMFANRAMRLFSRGARVVPIDPQRGSLSNLAFGVAALRQGYNLVWFPEGARSRSGQLQLFRPGIGLILTVQPVPVVPVWISGTYEAMPRGQRRLRRHPITITFGKPVDVETLRATGTGREPYERISTALHDCVAELGRMQRESHG